MYAESEFSSDSEFRLKVIEDLEELLDQIDDLDVDNFDSRLLPGNLSITFDDGRVILLSQQTPTHEIWLSANYNAWHFVSRNAVWLERDSGQEMVKILSDLLTKTLNVDVVLEL